jgi:DUSP domain
VKRNNKPHIPENHVHPGPMTNDEDLCDTNNPVNMTGTGTVDQFEKNVVDKYIKLDVRERFQYKLVNQELWNFLNSRYGGSEIKRYAIPLSMYSTTVETRLKQITVVVLPSSKLLSGALEGLDT